MTPKHTALSNFSTLPLLTFANSLEPDQARSGSKLFDTHLMVFLKEFFKKVDLEKKSAGGKKHKKIPRGQRERVKVNFGYFFLY